MQDPGIGHETHQIAILLPPKEGVVYSGRMSYSASAPVEVVVLHDIKPGETPAKMYTIDGEKKWALSLIKLGGDVGTAAGSMSFAGAALALHTLDGTEFTATVTVNAQAKAMKGELPSMMPPEEKPPTMMPSDAKTITVSEWAPWFQPSALQVDPGTPIVWDAGETATIHTITFVTRVTDLQLSMDPEFTVKTFTLLAPGDKSPVWTPEAGVYVYVCAIHPYMTGVVSAGVPYNAITGEMGTGEGDVTVAKFAPWYPSVAPWQDFRPYKAPPATPGVGEIWVNTQFEVATDPTSIAGKFGKPWPGTITIVDANTWEVTDKIGKGLNNPHNLWESGDGKYVIQTNWHDDYLTLIDVETREIVKNYIQTGPAPAHTFFSAGDKYVLASVNAGSEVQLFDAQQIMDPDVPASEIKPVGSIKASLPLAGPHGFWVTLDGLVSIPYHLANHAVVADLETQSELFSPINFSELDDQIAGDKIGPGIDLASYLGPEINGHRFWVTTEVLLSHAKLLQGRLVIYDIGSAVGGSTNPTFVKMLEVGSIPIQSPISPDGKYVVTANAGGLGVPATISVTQLDYNNPQNSRVVATLPSYPGAHGVEYGFKKGGGLYAYVSVKFAPVMQVVDLTTSPPSLAGEVDLGNGWGGMGILPIPAAGWYPTLGQHPLGKLYK
jgi:plastocyanin/DNA-binding beta-propeller fold protein YncE